LKILDSTRHTLREGRKLPVLETSITSRAGGPSNKLCTQVIRPSRDRKVHVPDFHVNNLGRKVRRLISRRDICQMVKHPNRSFETESRSHIPKTAGELCAVDLY
jgi:hypothetical protein